MTAYRCIHIELTNTTNYRCEVCMDYAENYLLKELESLENEYADLDVIVFDDLSLDPVTVQRVKKRKLWVKDRIFSIKSVLYPEVIA